ncbi:MAG: leucine-rich repeat domain-containing protein [Clostridiales bacterium]|nr:leucine-rich repeat domain-containing protein [Clostridiales bacterium]
MKSASLKKLLTVLFSFTAFFALFMITAYADDYGDFTYSLVEPEDGEDFESYNEIDGYSTDDETPATVVEIPSEIEDAAVTVISASAFAWNGTVEEFIIPDTVTTIEDGAFYNCTALKVVVIPDSVTYIGDSAFQNCTSLEYVIIGDGVITVGDVAFKGCSSLVAVGLGSSVQTIGNGAFYDCTALTEIFIPSSVTSIGSFALGYTQEDDEEKALDMTFYTEDTVAVLDSYISGTSFGSLTVAGCGDDHTPEWVLVRAATEEYTGLEIGICSVCKQLLMRDNNEISEVYEDDSALYTLIVAVIIVVILVVWIVIYIKRSKKRREKAIEDYKAGRPLDSEEERKAQEKKEKAKEDKKKAKQEKRLEKEKEIQG